jgi:hypothetical protein
MKKSVCLILVFFTFINLFSKPNEELLKTVRKATVYEDEIIGIAHRESKVYKAAQEYMSACSDKEIMELLNDENNIVRCYAATFIKDRNIKADWYNILFNELEDSEKINYQIYDLGYTPYVGDIFIEELFATKLNAEEQSKLKLQAIQKKSKLNFAKGILQSDEKSDELYKATREWALLKDEDAIFSLAKYQKKEDLPLIQTLRDINIELYFKACLYNLSESNKPYLKEYMISIMPLDFYSWKYKSFYTLVAAYHDDFSREIFDMAFSEDVNKRMQKYHVGFVYSAAKEYKDGFYDDYLKTLWLEYNLTDVDLIDYFLAKDKKFAIDAIKKSVKKSEVYFSNTKALDHMIKTLSINNVNLTDYFANGIKKAEVITFEVYMHNLDLIDIQNKKIINAMKQRLSKDTNQHVLFPLYENLMKLNDESINEFLVETYKKNRDSYTSWTIPDFEKLLEPILKERKK